VTVTTSTLSGNSATEGGGGIFNNSVLTVTGSTLSGNSASSGGGIANAYGTMYLAGTLLDTGPSGSTVTITPARSPTTVTTCRMMVRVGSAARGRIMPH